MDYEKLNEIAEKLESKYLPESAKGNEEAKEILAICQAYRIMSVKAESSNENSGLHLQHVSNNEVSVCEHKCLIPKNDGRLYCYKCGKSFVLA